MQFNDEVPLENTTMSDMDNAAIDYVFSWS